jgi:GGDEF domain-containing protein
VILPQTGKLGAQRVADRILELMADTVLTTPSGQLRLRCSIGLSVLEPPQGQSRDVSRPIPQSYFQEMALSLLQNAEGGLHQARSKGGACVAVGPGTNWAPYAL